MSDLPPPAAARAIEWPAFPRTEQIADIDRALTLGRSVLITEPPGAENSDIVKAALTADAGRRPIHRLRLHPTFADLTRQALAPLLPPGDATSTSALINAAAEHLIWQADGARIVIGVDDGQLLTEQAAQVLAGLARSGTAQLVVRARPTTLALPPWSYLHADGVLAHVPLPPLNETELRAHLSQAFGPVPEPTAHGLHRASAGLLTCVHALVADGVADGWLTPGADGWRLAAPATAGQQLIEAAESQLRAVPPSLANVCDLVALAGPAPSAALGELLSDALAEAIERGLVRESEGLVTLWAPVQAEAWRTLIRTKARVRWLERMYPSVPTEPAATMVRACLWALECGRPPSIEQIWRAARAACENDDPSALAHLSAAGLAALASNDPPPPADLPGGIESDLDRWHELARTHPDQIPPPDA